MAMALFAGLVSTAAPAGTGVWTTNGPSNSPQFGNVVLDPQTPGTVYASSSQGLSKSTDNGQTWFSVALSDQPANPLAAGPAGTVYASVLTDFQEIPPAVLTTIYKSTDGGGTWNTIVQRYNVSIGLVMDPTTPTTLYRVSSSYPTDLHFPVSTGSLHRSTDGGATWAAIDRGLDGNVITALAVDPKTPSTLYVASVPSGRPLSPLPPAAIFKSIDSGSTWTLLTTTVGAITSLVLDPVTPAIVYAAGREGVFRSADGGNAFVLINSTLTASANLAGMVIDPRDPRVLYAATLGLGVFESADSGVTWKAINNGLSAGSLYVTALVIDAMGTYLHATTEAPGVFDYQLRQPRLDIVPVDGAFRGRRAVAPRRN